MSAEGDVAKEAEAHAAIVERVMTWRPDRAKAAERSSVHCPIDGIEHTSGPGTGSIPRTRAFYGVIVEPSAAALRNVAHGIDVRAFVGKRQLIGRRMPPFEMLDVLKEIDVVP